MKKILENAIVRLLKRRPFYGHFLLACRRESMNGSCPVGVTIKDGVAVLAVDDRQLAAYPGEAQEALLEHVVKHLCHLHPARRKTRNAHDWDIACDLAINPTVPGMPADAPRPEAYGVEASLAAEEYYALLSSPWNMGNLEGSGVGNAGADTGGDIGPGAGEEQRTRGGTIDDHTLWADADSTPLRLAEEVVREMVREAWQKSDRQVPDDMRPLVELLLRPATIPWRQVLRQFVATAGRVGRQTTWMREHRRFAAGTPGSRKRHRLNLLIGVDVSDSTNVADLREAFASELMRIARGRDAQLTVLYANSRIRRIDSFKGDMVTVGRYDGGGFTDLRPVFDYARTIQPLPAAVIYLTDGIGPAPEQMEFPTLWVLTREGERPVPWGVELRLDV